MVNFDGKDLGGVDELVRSQSQHQINSLKIHVSLECGRFSVYYFAGCLNRFQQRIQDMTEISINTKSDIHVIAINSG